MLLFMRWEEERKSRQNGALRRLSRYGLPLTNIGRNFPKILWRLRKRIIAGVPIEKFIFPRTSDFRPYYDGYLKKAQKKLGERTDGSRKDAEIALRMRLDGYDTNTAVNTICERASGQSYASPEKTGSNTPAALLVFLSVLLGMWLSPRERPGRR